MPVKILTEKKKVIKEVLGSVPFNEITSALSNDELLSNLWNAIPHAMDSWAALQTGERDERVKELEEKLRWFATYELEKDSLFIYKVMQKSATLLLNRPNGV